MPSLLHRIALYAERHYRGIFLVAGALVVLSLLSASRLSFDADVLSLLPEHDPVVAEFKQTLQDFGGLDLLLVIIELPDDPVLGPYAALADALGPALEARSDIEWVDYQIGEPEALLQAFFPKSFLFLDEDGRRTVERRLSEAGMTQQAQELRHLITTPQALARKELMLLDPMGLAELFIGQLAGSSGSLGVDWTSGHYLSRDHRLLLLLAKPVRPPQDIPFTSSFMPDVRAQVEAIRDAMWDEAAGPDELAPPQIILGGGYLTALEDASVIKRDVITNAATSMVFVLLLFLFAFRRLGLLLYALVPLTTGLVLAFGVAGLATDKLSSATSGCAALLIGLGIDFVIVSYGRYVEERHAGRPPSIALSKMTGHCGRAVVIGGVTSAATFYAFAVTKFTGLRQMGLLTGTGILLCMLSVLFLLPALLAWSEARHQRKDSTPSLYLHGFGAWRVVRAVLRRPRAVLVAGALITLACVILVPRLHFESSIRNMRPQGHRGFEVQDMVADHFGSNFEYMMLVLEGETPEAVLDLAGEATRKAQPMVADGTLRSVESITRLIPPPEEQAAVLAWLDARRGDLFDAPALSARFDAALTAAGLNPVSFPKGRRLLLEAVDPGGAITLADLRDVDGTDRLVERYLRRRGDGWVGVVYLHMPPRVWKREPPPAAEALAASLGEGATLTGVNVVSRNLRTQVRLDATVACALGTVLVMLLLWLDFRRPVDTLLSLVPLGVGILWMLGAMVALGIDMNFMNIFVTTMIIGIGVDYGIHMLHRHRELQLEPPEVWVAGLGETAKAIAMAAVSTIVGFGSLVLSHYPGLRSIGQVAILGALLTALVAITLLPAYLAMRRGDVEAIRRAADSMFEEG